MIKGLYWMDADEQVFDSIYRTLAMSGEYENKEYLIEDQVHEIMDNPQIYPEYFNWLMQHLKVSLLSTRWRVKITCG